MSWSSPTRDANGRLSNQTMIADVSRHILLRWLTPHWAYRFGRLIPKLQRVDEAYTTFERLMNDQIATRQEEITKARAMAASGETGEEEIAESIQDVFGRLVNARLSDGNMSLSNEDIIGNCFIFVRRSGIYQIV